METFNDIVFFAGIKANKEYEYWVAIGVHSQDALDSLFRDTMFRIVNHMLKEKCGE